MLHCTLQQLPVGTPASVCALLHTDCATRRRLLDIGLTQGAKITCLFESPPKDPRAYLIRGAVIALRAEEAENTTVTFSNGKDVCRIDPVS